ncbi:hypothetical protein U9M48_007093 [Paspalum notatum var. saurae]|uniref:SAC domain-containing protein n=1 Tax=Paspalum notatum var. saurae TaxID=547442 RepID=A0AAQ3SGR2_PASNO
MARADNDEAPLLAEEPLRPGACSRELELREFRDRYVIRSLDGGAAFAVARSGGSIRRLSSEEAAAGSDCKVSRIYGVAGIIKLLAGESPNFTTLDHIVFLTAFSLCIVHCGAFAVISSTGHTLNSIDNAVLVDFAPAVESHVNAFNGSYVLVITSRKEAGSYQGCPVYHVNSMKFLCCKEAIKHLTSQEKRDEAYFMSLLRIAESTCGLYYTYERDLTLKQMYDCIIYRMSLCLQRASKLTAGRIHKPLWKQADPRFVWNKNLLEELIEAKLDEFIIPMIQGNIQKHQIIS